ncbi:coenzyme F420-0:L-glutamate ligase [Nocardioides flavescens]|uniref:Coenzyme F420-0:L-glutamate ligase n=1 Tax=Nocardioides flavescens TaxID=2691959 RepID=A0A6L7EYS8_9ACTN|nr:coenzyme F420-0:L-glutamate ligase [Nocardioides flavescens]
MSGSLGVVAPDGVPEVRPGDDLVALVVAAFPQIADGDVVVVTSKVVSKAEGRLVPGSDRAAVLPAETERVVARRGPTTIVRTRTGLTMAAAGIDNSNVEAGTLALLPLDPDASARALRRALAERTGRNVGVVVTDTAGRAWRTGQTDIAIGAAGLVVIDDHAGRTDAYGNPLAVTAPAVADELASAAELVLGKLTARPFALVRGRGDLVLPRGLDGTGAKALVRPEGEDLFGYGAREAVVRALAGRPEDRAPFGAPAALEEVAAAVELVTGTSPRRHDGALVCTDDPRLPALAMAHGWVVDVLVGSVTHSAPAETTIRPATP